MPPLKVTAQKGDLTTWKGDAVVVNLFKDVKRPGGATGAVDKALGGAVTRLIKSGDLTGKLGQSAMLYANGELGAPRVLVVGLGDKDVFDIDAVRRAAGATVRALRKAQVKKAATVVHGAGVGGLDAADSARAMAEAAISAAYTFDRKSKDAKKEQQKDRTELASLVLVEQDASKARAVKKGAAAGAIVGEAQSFARDVASISGTEGAPTAIASLVRRTVKGTGLTCKVLTKAQIEQQRMGGVLAVSQGSANQPRFVVLEWKPAKPRAKVAVVGKGVTFDTGGISIKPSQGMDQMRYDKGGAAATYGVLLAAAGLKVPVHVIGITPLVENMPSGTAIKPGDVITMRSGKTVDVLNTDAEGRLILGDALDYAKGLKPDHTVDMATLTGAASIAVGTQAVALMSNDDELTGALEAAGEDSHERVWELPFYEEYDEQIKGVVGDIKNIGGRNAGTITAGKFLEHFAPDSWAHLDIASTAWNDEKPHFNAGYYPDGATGVGVRLLTTWIESL